MTSTPARPGEPEPVGAPDRGDAAVVPRRAAAERGGLDAFLPGPSGPSGSGPSGSGPPGPGSSGPSGSGGPDRVASASASPERTEAPAADDVEDELEPYEGTPGTRRRRRRARRRRSRTRNAVEWVVVLVAAVVIAVLIKTFLFQAFYIPSVSMEPTLEVGDRVLVNKLSYDLHDVGRGDVVVFARPPGPVGAAEPEIKDLIKRVVGLPGETVELRNDGLVYVDGEPLDEPYLPSGGLDDGPGDSFTAVVVPEGHVWVMGDNRDNSSDSRVFGSIPIDSIVGRAFVLVWPIGDIGGL